MSASDAPQTANAFTNDALGTDDGTALAERIRRRDLSVTELTQTASVPCCSLRLHWNPIIPPGHFWTVPGNTIKRVQWPASRPDWAAPTLQHSYARLP